MFIHKNINPGAVQVFNHSPTFQTAVIKFRNNSRNMKIAMHNVYLLPPNSNPDGADGVPSAADTMTLIEANLEHFAGKGCEQVLLGDFNSWHPDWNGENCSHVTGQAIRLKHITAQYNMELNLEPNTITRPSSRGNGGSTIDLIWSTQQTTEQLCSCEPVEFLQKSSDHVPIRTVFAFSPEQAKEQREWKFKKADWQLYSEELTSRLPTIGRIHTQAQPDTLAEELTTAITDALNTAVPRTKRSPYMRPGWNEACTEAISTVKRAKRRFQATGHAVDKEVWKTADAEKRRILRVALTDDHRERVSQCDTVEQLWKLCKWVKNRGSIRTAFMPEIRDKNKVIHTEHEAKAKALQEVLFPQAAPADLSDIPDQPPIFPATLPFPTIMEHEVMEAIRLSKGDNAPGSDGIQNLVLKRSAKTIAPLLTQIYNASLELHYWPAAWKEATVVVIRKPNKGDYHDPKSYRPKNTGDQIPSYEPDQAAITNLEVCDEGSAFEDVPHPRKRQRLDPNADLNSEAYNDPAMKNGTDYNKGLADRPANVDGPQNEGGTQVTTTVPFTKSTTFMEGSRNVAPAFPIEDPTGDVYNVAGAHRLLQYNIGHHSWPLSDPRNPLMDNNYLAYAHNSPTYNANRPDIPELPNYYNSDRSFLPQANGSRSNISQQENVWIWGDIDPLVPRYIGHRSNRQW